MNELKKELKQGIGLEIFWSSAFKISLKRYSIKEKKVSELIYPTNEHKEYMMTLKRYCEDENIGLFVTGSLEEGTARKHSDIDVVLVSNDIINQMETISELYSEPVLKSVTHNPKGILILIFKSGLCVDMDIREKISINDVNKMIEVVPPKHELVIAEIAIQRSNLPYVIYKSEYSWQNEIRLIHRSLIKHLNGKFDIANLILNELIDNIPENEFQYKCEENYVEQMTAVLNIYSKHYKLKGEFISMIKSLIIECEKIC